MKVHTEALKIQTDFFLNHLTNLITEVPGAFEGRPALIKRNIGEARLYGYEIFVEQAITVRTVFKASISYIRGEDIHNNTNLPQISPLKGEIALSGFINKIGTLNFSSSFYTEQKDLAAGEKRTPGYGITNINFVSVPVEFGRLSLTVRTGIQNLFDKAYRNHLSTLRGIIKDEPGRNFFLSAAFAV